MCFTYWIAYKYVTFAVIVGHRPMCYGCRQAELAMGNLRNCGLQNAEGNLWNVICGAMLLVSASESHM